MSTLDWYREFSLATAHSDEINRTGNFCKRRLEGAISSEGKKLRTTDPFQMQSFSQRGLRSLRLARTIYSSLVCICKRTVFCVKEILACFFKAVRKPVWLGKLFLSIQVLGELFLLRRFDVNVLLEHTGFVLFGLGWLYEMQIFSK